MFFFIAGIQPKTITLEEPSRRCPSCGLDRAQTKRVDHYLSVFFLPILRVKRGEPFLQCQSCGSLSTGLGDVWSPSHEAPPGPYCPYCHKPLDPQFQFCPFCGRRL